MFEKLLARFGYVKADKATACALSTNQKFEFGSSDLQQCLLSNSDLFPEDVRQKIESGSKVQLGVTATFTL